MRLILGPTSEDAWVTVTGRRVRSIRARFVAGGSTAVLRVRLPRRGVRVVLKIVARDAVGNATAKKRTIRLRR